MATRPHFDLPFRVEYGRGGQATIPVTEQDSLAEIENACELALRFEQGDRRTLPGYGRPRSLAFTTDPDLARAQIQPTIDDAEPRMRALVLSMRDLDDPGLIRILAMYETGVIPE
jgi:hypothetical protein